MKLKAGEVVEEPFDGRRVLFREERSCKPDPSIHLNTLLLPTAASCPSSASESVEKASQESGYWCVTCVTDAPFCSHLHGASNWILSYGKVKTMLMLLHLFH